MYFPVPVGIARNDTSPGQEEFPQQWQCVACCSQGCGFTQGSRCNTQLYTFPPKGNNDFGCDRCGPGLDKAPGSGSTKLYYSDLSTGGVYRVEDITWTSEFP